MGMLDAFSGGAFQNMTLFALGIIPYINSSIIMNLLTIAIPALEEMQKEGEDGRKKIASITRYGTTIGSWYSSYSNFNKSYVVFLYVFNVWNSYCCSCSNDRWNSFP
jgi:preprotein translocase subunit SecY